MTNNKDLQKRIKERIIENALKDRVFNIEFLDNETRRIKHLAKDVSTYSPWVEQFADSGQITGFATLYPVRYLRENGKRPACRYKSQTMTTREAINLIKNKTVEFLSNGEICRITLLPITPKLA